MPPVFLFAENCTLPDGVEVKSVDSFKLWFRVVSIACTLVGLLIVLLGLIGNTFNFFILYRLRSSLPYKLLLFITFFDDMRLIGNGTDYVFHALESLGTNLSGNLVKFIGRTHSAVLVAKHTGSNASIAVLALLSVVQVFSVRRPMSPIPSRPILFFAAVLSLLQLGLCAPYGVLTTAFYCPELRRFKFKFTQPAVTRYRIYVEAILHTILPTVIVVLVSRALLRDIRKANAQREDMTKKSGTQARLSVSKAVLKLNLIFLATSVPHLVYIGLYIMSLTAKKSSLEVKNMIVYAADIAACVNSAVNFVIYYTTDRRFARALNASVLGRSEPSELSGSRSNYSMKKVATVEGIFEQFQGQPASS